MTITRDFFSLVLDIRSSSIFLPYSNKDVYIVELDDDEDRDEEHAKPASVPF